MTRLDCINQMLAAISEAPVSTENSQHPDVLTANNLLNYLLEQLQSPGASYNREYNVTLAYDTSTKEVRVPSNTLQVDPVDVKSPLVQRGIRLYDPSISTFLIGVDVTVDLVVQLPFEEVPPEAQHYISADGAYRLHLDKIGDERKLQRLLLLLTNARSAYRAAELTALDINARSTPSAVRMLSGIRPYRRS